MFCKTKQLQKIMSKDSDSDISNGVFVGDGGSDAPAIRVILAPHSDLFVFYSSVFGPIWLIRLYSGSVFGWRFGWILETIWGILGR